MSGFFLFLVFVGDSTTCQSTPTPSESLITPLLPSLACFILPHFFLSSCIASALADVSSCSDATFSMGSFTQSEVRHRAVPWGDQALASGTEPLRRGEGR